MEVSPDKQNIDALFSNTSYHIDFYQREYKWTEYEVTRLLEDVFYHFEQSYAVHPNLDPSLENVSHEYRWYYLNTYITNRADGKVFVVDGQQRLTTLTLILIALYRMCRSETYGSEQMGDWLKAKIAGVGVGGKRQFWMAHEKRRLLMQALLEAEAPSESMIEDGISARNIITNYAVIQKQLSERLPDRHKLETFIYYFLGQVVIINLEVEQTDVPMVFEVINDRGIGLQPYEILKGKLLGEIEKAEVDTYADIWEHVLRPIEARASEAADAFFRTYLRARFADSRGERRDFDGPYHRAIFDGEAERELQLRHNPGRVKEFLKGQFRYHAKLFLRLSKLGDNLDDSCPECYYNSQLNRMDGHVMLTMATCEVDDPAESEKIRAVARAFDRAYVMLQLNRAYDSNQFQELQFSLNKLLRGCPAAEIEGRINDKVLDNINTRRNTAATELLSYGQFRQVGYADFNTRFQRYFLARIEAFLATGLEAPLHDSLFNYVAGVGRTTGYHVEHILSRNDESRTLFVDSQGEVDEALFENERNRFAALLLLKGRDNISSGNENYAQKLKTYTGHAPYWAQTLVQDFYKSNTAMKDFTATSGLKFESVPVFTRDALEQRSDLLYKIVKRIWEV